MEDTIMSTAKKIRLGIALAALAILAGCGGADESGSPQQGGGSTPTQITITVAGDEHAVPKADHTFKVDPGTKWESIKLLANRKINYTPGYENKTWKFNNASGGVILDDYQFNADTTVYAESQPITTPHVEVIITVDGDPHITHKSTDHTFKVNKGETWNHVKSLAADTIEYAEGYENDTWKLAGASGAEILSDHKFETNTTVYAVSKKKTITITVGGDENVVLKTPGDRTFTAYYGDTWDALKTQAEGKITYKPNYENKGWKHNDSAGEPLIGTHRFIADTTVFAESKLKDITLTITGDHVDISEPKELIVPYGTKWGDIKGNVISKVTPHANFQVIVWRKRGKTGAELNDNDIFGGNTIIYAETQQINVTITIKGDGHVQLAADSTITKPYGVTWGEIKDEAKTKITCNSGYVFAAWKKGSATAENELADVDDFKEDTDVYATTQQVPVSVGVKITPPAGGITGHNISYTLPAADASSWKGVFIDGRTVNLNAYNIGKYEVSVKIWNEVYEWAKENGYSFFDFDPEDEDTPSEDEQPMANINWRDCITWCNAYTEMWFGTTNECVYRKGSVSGQVIKDGATDGDSAYCDFSKKGYRLPTEAEWEYAARYQGTDNVNAEQYGSIYLTNLNSASGATKPVGFENMAMPSGETYETLRAETARVAIFNKWWDGTAFVPQTPPVSGRANVGSKPANKLGLCDMSGNVAEWCWDLYIETVTSSTDEYPTGPFPSHETTHIVRGGYWSSGIDNAVYFCMTGKRDKKASSRADPIRGFRLAWKE